MENILNFILSNMIISFIILVGIVVFFHEWGHFLAARALGIKVEEFAIGFGPQAFSFTYNDVVYKICWIPLGGYVRMYGSEIDGHVPLERQHEALLYAQPWKRFVIAIAGPLGNCILCFIILLGLAFYGTKVPPPMGTVLKNSVAEKSGLQTGDKIVSINGEKIYTFQDMVEKIKSFSDTTDSSMTLEIERNHQLLSLNITPETAHILDELGKKVATKKIGIVAMLSEPRIFVQENSLAFELGLRSNDKIVAINGENIRYFHEIQRIFSLKEGGVITVERPIKSKQNLKTQLPAAHDKNNTEKNKDFEIEIINISVIQTMAEKLASFQQKNLDISLEELGIRRQELTVRSLFTERDKKSYPTDWAACGVKEGDNFYQINTQNQNWLLASRADLFWAWETLIQNAQNTQWLKVHVTVLRENTTEPVKLICTLTSRNVNDSRLKKVFDLPSFAAEPVLADTVFVKANSLKEASLTAWKLTTEYASLIARAIFAMFQGDVSVSELGGPIAMAHMAGEAAKAGWDIFLRLAAFISVNVGIFNLVPIPVFDGGTILLSLVEMAYGKRLPPHIHIRLQTLGVFFIVILIIFVMINDIVRCST